MIETHTATGITALLEDLCRRLDAARAAIPTGTDEYAALRDLLNDLHAELDDDADPPEPILAALARALTTPTTPAATTLVAGETADIARLAVAIYDHPEPTPGQLAKARLWLARLAEQGAHRG